VVSVRCFGRNLVDGFALPCEHEAKDRIADQYFCGYHAEQIVEAVLGRLRHQVYFAERQGQIKIGISLVPEERCRQLRARLLATEPGGRGREWQLHLLFAEHRIDGEWFKPAPELLEHIAHLPPIQEVA
jgi:hypothetical protein